MSYEGHEMQCVQEAFDSNWIAPLGTNVNEFEKELSILALWLQVLEDGIMYCALRLLFLRQ